MPLDITSILSNTIAVAAIIWFILLVISIITLLKRKDMIKPVKIFWSAIILFAPVVGLLFYLFFGFKKSEKHIQRSRSDFYRGNK